jgi:hypothetical protein
MRTNQRKKTKIKARWSNVFRRRIEKLVRILSQTQTDSS